MLVEVDITNLSIDPANNMPFVVLTTRETKRTLPIWIGLFEASAIASKLQNVQVARPMTHDLLGTMLESLGGKVVRAEIHDLRENTYYASLVIRRESGEERRVDSRPSDAIALALRTDAPILAEETLFGRPEVSKAKEEPRAKESGKGWEEILKNLSPEAFGKYKQ